MLEQNRSSDSFSQQTFPITLVSLVVGLLIGGYLVLSSKDGLSGILQQAEKSHQTYTGQPTDDNDHDGLTNEDEVKIGTNPQQADTDKDGYFDGEEILSGYNPLKARPADRIIDDYFNLTNIFEEGVKKAADNEEISSGLSSAATQLQPFILQQFLPPASLSEQIKITSDNSQGKTDSYKSNLKIILDKNFSAIGDANQSNLNKYYLAINNTLNESKNLIVPTNLLDKHRDLIFLLWTAKNTIESFSNYNADPLKAFVAIQVLSSLFQ